MRSVERAKEKLEAREQRDSERWLLSTWAATQGNFHALRFSDEVPPTKEEHEKRRRAEKAGKEPPINWKEVEASRKAMLDSRESLLYALRGPQYFGAWLGAESILGPPDESLEEYKARREEEERLASESQREQGRAAEGRVVSLLERLEASD